MNPSAWRGITWALSAWIVAPVLMIAVVVFLGVVDRTMTTQSSESSSVPSSVSSESSSVPTCRADDFYCAPIYDPSATVILIRPASGAVPEIPAAWIDAEEDAAWTDTLVQLFSIVWVFGFVVLVALWRITWLVALWRITWPRRVSLPGWRKMTWVLNAWIAMSAVATVVAIVGSSRSTNHSPTGCFPSDYFCALTSNDGTTVSFTYVSMLGLIGFIVLGLIWLFTLHRSLTCPSCGRDLREKQQVCGNCGQKLLVLELLLPRGTNAG